MNDKTIEVIIKKRKATYLAYCKMFPSCKGIGKTKKEALKKLSNSIGLFISKLLNNTLDQVFESDNYTEVLFDQTSESNEERISYSLNSDLNLVQKSFLFKVFGVESSDENEDEYDEDDEDELNYITSETE